MAEEREVEFVKTFKITNFCLCAHPGTDRHALMYLYVYVHVVICVCVGI